jgi:hypothetical protein
MAILPEEIGQHQASVTPDKTRPTPNVACYGSVKNQMRYFSRYEHTFKISYLIINLPAAVIAPPARKLEC